jgi:threonine/homoserine/homoserine lactone efflux protein
MINLTTLFLYTIGAAVIIIAPGPDFLYVTARGMAQGRKAGILSAAGISMGLLIHTMLAALGLSAVLNASRVAFDVLKYIGAAYLLYLGFRALTAKNGFMHTEPRNTCDTTAVFQQGVLTNVLNPKAMITFMAFIPQFIRPEEGNSTLQVFLLGGIIALLAILWFGLVGYFAGSLGGWLMQRQSVQRVLRWITGGMLMGLGLKLALSKRTA